MSASGSSSAETDRRMENCPPQQISSSEQLPVREVEDPAQVMLESVVFAVEPETR